MTRSTLAVLALVASALVTASACRQIAGIHERASEQALCAQCIDGSCSAQSSACTASASCASRLDCALACDPTQPDAASCQANCAATPAGDYAAVAAVSSCAATSCAPDCAIQCGGVLPLAPPQAAVACSACVASKCCQQASACAAEPECLSGLECARGESTPDTVQTCTDVKHAAGASAYHALDDCMAGLCAQDCAVGADWACVGHVSVPIASTSTISGTLDVVNAVAQTVPIPGLQVTGCGSTDPTCATPLTAVFVTDSSGAASIILPTTAQSGRTGFQGYLKVVDPQNNYLPDLVFQSPAATQSSAVSTIVMATASLEQEIAAGLDVTFDPAMGSMILTAVDCANRPAPDVTFAVEANGMQPPVYYTANAVPSVTAQATDARGTALVGEVPPGAASVTVRSLAIAKTIATVQLFASASALTILRVAPGQ